MSTLDNNLIENNSSNESPWGIAMRYGGITAAILIVLGLVGQLTGLADPEQAANPSTMSYVLNFLNFAVWIGGAVMAVRAFRGSNGGYATFGEGFKTSFFTFLVVGVITAIWTFVNFSFIQPDFLSDMMDFQREAFETQGMDEDAIDMAMSYTAMFMSPGGMAAYLLVMSLIGGAIISAIIGAIMKKEAPEY